MSNRIAILTANSLAGHIATMSLTRSLGDQVVAVFVLDEIRDRGLRKLRAMCELLRTKSIRFLIYRAFESVGFRLLRFAVHWMGFMLFRRGLPIRCRPIPRMARPSVGFARFVDTSCPRFRDEILACAADVVVSAYLTQIVPGNLLESTPRMTWINVHSSLLPHHRGSAPYFWALAAGARQTGITIHELAPRLDTGPVYAQHRVSIDEMETVASLHLKLIRRGTACLIKVLERLAGGEKITLSKQGSSRERRVLPTRCDLRQLHRAGHGLWRGRDVADLMRYLGRG
jgi:hypothetical protein